MAFTAAEEPVQLGQGIGRPTGVDGIREGPRGYPASLAQIGLNLGRTHVGALAVGGDQDLEQRAQTADVLPEVGLDEALGLAVDPKGGRPDP